MVPQSNAINDAHPGTNPDITANANPTGAHRLLAHQPVRLHAMIKRKKGAIGGNAGVITDLNTRCPTFQAHMMINTDPLPQPNRAMNNAISGNLAAISHENIATRLG
jgi:hypothetical protein